MVRVKYGYSVDHVETGHVQIAAMPRHRKDSYVMFAPDMEGAKTC